jgi:hypothetical protein
MMVVLAHSLLVAADPAGGHAYSRAAGRGDAIPPTIGDFDANLMHQQ